MTDTILPPELVTAGSSGRQTSRDSVDVETVAAFAQFLLPQAIPQARVVIMFITVATAVFAATDYDLFGTSRTFWALSAYRAAVVVCGIVAFARLRSDASSRTLTSTLFVFTLLIGGFFATLAPFRTSAALSYPLVGLAIVLLSYLAVPLTPRLQAGPAILASVGVLWWAILGTISIPMRIALFIVFVGGNIAAGVVSAQLRSSQWRHFLALRVQTEALARLERALAEVRALRGILPICSHCKNVRDDGGYWHEVEVYMREHSEAEFSHAICPHCLVEFYPEYAAAVTAGAE